MIKIPQTPAHPAPAITERVFHSLLRTWNLLRQAQDPYFARFGISGSQWGILRVLQRAELKGEAELPLKGISERLLVQPSSVTGVVDRMERQGLVKRSPSTKDARVRNLGLTQRGRDLLGKVLTHHADRIQSLFTPLQPGEQETMLQFLQRLEDHLQTLISKTPPAGHRHGQTKMRRIQQRNSPGNPEPQQTTSRA
jgi:DNA-binding MarR family transcriptional regulator